MRLTVSKQYLKITFLSLLLGILCGLDACQKGPLHFEGKILLPTGRIIDVALAKTLPKQAQGLSGVRDQYLKPHQGMLFIYAQMAPRQFWMPNTYIDLDIFFLNQDYKVIGIARFMKKHPKGTKGPPAITKQFTAKFILELRSDSPSSKSIHLFDTLKYQVRK